MWANEYSNTGRSWGPDVLSSPREAVEARLARVLDQEPDLVCGWAGQFVFEEGIGFA